MGTKISEIPPSGGPPWRTAEHETDRAELRRVAIENVKMRAALKLIEARLGIQPDFVPLGLALELSAVITTALAPSKVNQ